MSELCARMMYSFAKPVPQIDQTNFSLTEFWAFELYQTYTLPKSCTDTTVIPLISIISYMT